MMVQNQQLSNINMKVYLKVNILKQIFNLCFAKRQRKEKTQIHPNRISTLFIFMLQSHFLSGPCTLDFKRTGFKVV